VAEEILFTVSIRGMGNAPLCHALIFKAVAPFGVSYSHKRRKLLILKSP
jgi:hypothetical protein